MIKTNSTLCETRTDPFTDEGGTGTSKKRREKMRAGMLLHPGFALEDAGNRQHQKED
jgi:hypothetical protein